MQVFIRLQALIVCPRILLATRKVVLEDDVAPHWLLCKHKLRLQHVFHLLRTRCHFHNEAQFCPLEDQCSYNLFDKSLHFFATFLRKARVRFMVNISNVSCFRTFDELNVTAESSCIRDPALSYVSHRICNSSNPRQTDFKCKKWNLVFPKMEIYTWLSKRKFCSTGTNHFEVYMCRARVIPRFTSTLGIYYVQKW